LPELEMVRKVTKAGVSIAYEVVGEGIPLTLLHPIFETREFWRHSGYFDAFRKIGRQLVLIDASGHGESSKPHDKDAYALRRRVDEVAAVLDDLRIKTTEVLGYSMGGWMALGLVCHHPDRVRRAAVGGAVPYAQDLQPLRDVVARGPREWVSFLASRADDLPADMRERVLANDQLALSASVAEDRPDISDQVAASGIPLLFFAGAKDPLHARCKEFAETTRSRFVSVPGAHHIQTLLERDIVVREVSSFLQGEGSDVAERETPKPSGPAVAPSRPG
jgi:pimeloyl-ACP methyl ester carboxylesterase